MLGHVFGYARTSTFDQTAGIEAQIRDLKAAGCTKIFCEQLTSVIAKERDQLAAAIDYLREGDVLVVTKLDRLARSLPHLNQVIETIRGKCAELRILNMGVDTTSATGRKLLQMLGSVAEFEREVMLESQREGIARAKSVGKYKGRKPTARVKAPAVLELNAEGIGATEISKRLQIGRASVYRILNDPTVRQAA